MPEDYRHCGCLSAPFGPRGVVVIERSESLMGWQEHPLYADDHGLRVGGRDDPYRAFSWDSVTRLLAYTVSDNVGTFAVLEIHHDDEWEEVLTIWADYPAVAAHISAHLPGIRRDWQKAAAAAPSSEPATIWERAAAKS